MSEILGRRPHAMDDDELLAEVDELHGKVQAEYDSLHVDADRGLYDARRAEYNQAATEARRRGFDVRLLAE